MAWFDVMQGDLHGLGQGGKGVNPISIDSSATRIE
jgi:hypothetical protein